MQHIFCLSKKVCSLDKLRIIFGIVKFRHYKSNYLDILHILSLVDYNNYLLGIEDISISLSPNMILLDIQNKPIHSSMEYFNHILSIDLHHPNETHVDK